jgi:hypothetical protein
MSKLCLFLPGFGGSVLFSGPNLSDYLWVNRVRLAVGAVELLRLSPDGVNPPNSSYPPITARGALSPYYDSVQGEFVQQLSAEGFVLQVIPFDWRLSTFRTGADLAKYVIAAAPQFDGVALVGHSQGGLVCRRAWSILQQLGQQSLVQRVVTLGTAHLGSWAPEQLLSGAGDYVDQMMLIAPTVLNFLTGTTLPATVADLVRLAATWPGLYELLPAVQADPPSGPVVAALYDAGSWPTDSGVSQFWLDHAKGPFQSWLLDQTAIPPYEVLTTFAGGGFPTVSSPATVGGIGFAADQRMDLDGDGTVSQVSALAPVSLRLIRASRHTSLPADLVASGELAAEVAAVRPPLPPPPPPPVPPPPVRLAGAVSPIMPGPPLALSSINLDP